MSFNIAGAAAAYQGYTDENRRLAEDERRAKAAERTEQDAAYTEQLRTRQRAEWAESDRNKAADKEDLSAVNAQFAARQLDDAADAGQAEHAQAKQMVQQDQMQAEIDKANATMGAADVRSAVTPAFKLAPAGGIGAPGANSPKLAPEVSTKVQELRGPTGMPQPRNFNDALERQAALLERKSARGAIDPKHYAEQMAFISNMQKEGVHDALAAFATGDYEGGLASFNRVGKNKGATLIKGAEGVTKINGEDMPTHFITLRNADGTHATMDVAKAQFQLMDLNSRLNHSDRARQTEMQREQHAAQNSLGRDQLAQQAKDAAAGRSAQAAHLALARQQFDANTPFGQIAAKEKAMGRAMTPEQKINFLGVDNMPAANRAVLNSLLDEQKLLKQSLYKSQTDGSWQPESAGARELATRSVELGLQVSNLLAGQHQAGVNADPSGILGKPAAAKTVPNPVAPDAPAQRQGAPLAPVGGVGIAPTAQATAERDRRMTLFNNTVGGVSRVRQEAVAARTADVAANFDAQLGKIQRGMPRQEAQQVLSWFDTQTDAGNLTNQQLKQLRAARQSAGM